MRGEGNMVSDSKPIRGFDSLAPNGFKGQSHCRRGKVPIGGLGD